MLSVKSVCCKPGSCNKYVGSNPTLNKYASLHKEQ